MSNEVTDEERTLFSTWTEVDGDLHGLDSSLAQAVLESRLSMARGDRPRTSYWQVPEGIDCINDIDYIGDGIRAHKLDVYVPHDAVVRGGKSAPIYIDIHGGGFLYGYKELNRNFCTHLAQEGFVVFSLNYRLFPSADFIGQLADVEAGFSWIANHLADYPVDASSVFVTGDSAGGTLGLYSVALERSQDMAQAFGLQQAGLSIKGGALVSGLFDVAPYLNKASTSEDVGAQLGDSPTDAIAFIAPRFFGSMVGTAMTDYVDLGEMAERVDLPPFFLNTSNDDFLQADSLLLGIALYRAGRDFELRDLHTAKGQALGHVYPVCMSWLDESRETLRRIRDFSYSRLSA